MATILCSVQRETLYEVYIEYSVKQDPVKATSTITHALKLKQLKDGYDFNGNMNITYTIGTKSFTYNANFNIDDKGDAGSIFTIKTGDAVVIQHNTTTGVGSFTVECSGSCDSNGYGPGTITLAKKTVTLNTIDRVAPKLTISVSQVTAKSLNLTAESHAIPDKWEYSLDNGSTWVEFSTSKNKKVSTTITGLSPNTTYTIKVRARREYNQVSGVSSAVSAKTLGNSLLNSVNTLTLNVDNPVLTMSWTVYENYTHKVVVKDNDTIVLIIPDLTCSVGTNNKSISLTTRQREILLDHMANKNSWDATFELTTLDGTTQIGDTSVVVARIEITNSAAPVLNNFSHSDYATETFKLTSSKTKYIKGYSDLRVTIGTCTPFDGATITSYRVTVGSQVKDFDTSSNTLSFGEIKVSGDNVTLRVEVFDSRGFSSFKDTTITVYDYEDVVINDYSIRRVNEVGATVQLSLSGSYSPVYVDSVEKNSIKSLKFQYAPSGGNWSSSYDLNFDKTGGSFSFDTTSLSAGGTVINFDPAKQYTIEIEVSDALSSDSMSIILNKGTPLVAFRSKKVGINESNPTAALHVRADEGEVPFKINGNEVDFIVESDTVRTLMMSGTEECVWYYEKWNSGVVECWGSIEYTELTCNKAWGTVNETPIMYETRQLANALYPINLVEPPFEVVSVVGKGAGCMLEYFNSNNALFTSTVCVVRPKPLDSMDLTLEFYVRGHWK